MLRDPLTHLVSHLSWVKNLRSNLFRWNKTPKRFQDLCDKMNLVDFSNVDEVRKLFEEMPPNIRSVFDNCQTRYLSGFVDETYINEDVLEQAISSLQSYNLLEVLITFNFSHRNSSDFFNIKNKSFKNFSSHQSRKPKNYG